MFNDFYEIVYAALKLDGGLRKKIRSDTWISLLNFEYFFLHFYINCSQVKFIFPWLTFFGENVYIGSGNVDNWMLNLPRIWNLEGS